MRVAPWQYLLLLASPLLLPTASPAALVWEHKEIEVAADIFDEKAEVEFAFTNAGTDTVTITSLSSQCGCTIAALDKRVYAPGEKGAVKVTFTFDGRTGRNTKTVTVATDTAGNAFDQLLLTVDIPNLFKVPVSFVMWRVGDPIDSKSVSIRPLHPDRVIPVSVQSRSPEFSASLEPDPDDPSAFRVKITPADTSRTRQASIIVKTNAPAEDPRVVTLYALVR